MTNIIGITGGFASGKTVIARMFEDLGAVCIDADKIYHSLIKDRGGLLYREVVSAFGGDILDEDMEIDRKKLGKLVFGSTRKMKRLNQITHPEIIKEMLRELSRLKSQDVKCVVVDAPLLIEAGLLEKIDKLAVVKINREKQIARCKKQRGLSCDEIKERAEAQMSQKLKVELADYVIDNNGSMENTRRQVKNVWKDLKLK